MPPPTLAPSWATCNFTPGPQGVGIAGQHAIGRVQGSLPDAKASSTTAATQGHLRRAGEPTLRPQTRG